MRIRGTFKTVRGEHVFLDCDLVTMVEYMFFQKPYAWQPKSPFTLTAESDDKSQKIVEHIIHDSQIKTIREAASEYVFQEHNKHSRKIPKSLDDKRSQRAVRAANKNRGRKAKRSNG